MELIVALIVSVTAALIGGLALDRIRGVARRAEGQMARALQGIPEDDDRERWLEELRRVLAEFDGRPYKQLRESRELIRAAERLVSVYAVDAPRLPQAAGRKTEPDPEFKPMEAFELGVALSKLDSGTVKDALSNLSYRERRVLEFRFGLQGEERRSFLGIARTFNITEKRVREIEQLSLAKLAWQMEQRRLRDEI